jgi:hypothetical protein
MRKRRGNFMEGLEWAGAVVVGVTLVLLKLIVGLLTLLVGIVVFLWVFGLLGTVRLWLSAFF